MSQESCGLTCGLAVLRTAQVGPLIETLTSRKGELLELAPVAQGTFGSAQHDSNLPSLQEAAHASGAAATAASSDRQRLVFEVNLSCLASWATQLEFGVPYLNPPQGCAAH